MKILNILLIFCLLSTIHANAGYIPNKAKPVMDSVTLKANKLKQLYILSKSSSPDVSATYKQQFFEEFPSTFKQLNDLYGYNYDTNTIAPLEKLYAEHIELFNGLNNVSDTLYYRKIILIAVGGHWDADAVNVFQQGLRNKILAKPELTAYILKNMPDNKIKSFWYFYFDGAHPKKQITEPLLRLKADTRIYNLMIEAQNDVLKHSK